MAPSPILVPGLPSQLGEEFSHSARPRSPTAVTNAASKVAFATVT
jgi:hypothetical protein